MPELRHSILLDHLRVRVPSSPPSHAAAPAPAHAKSPQSFRYVTPSWNPTKPSKYDTHASSSLAETGESQCPHFIGRNEEPTIRKTGRASTPYSHAFNTTVAPYVTEDYARMRSPYDDPDYSLTKEAKQRRKYQMRDRAFTPPPRAPGERLPSYTSTEVLRYSVPSKKGTRRVNHYKDHMFGALLVTDTTAMNGQPDGNLTSYTDDGPPFLQQPHYGPHSSGSTGRNHYHEVAQLRSRSEPPYARTHSAAPPSPAAVDNNYAIPSPVAHRGDDSQRRVRINTQSPQTRGRSPGSSPNQHHSTNITTPAAVGAFRMPSASRRRKVAQSVDQRTPLWFGMEDTENPNDMSTGFVNEDIVPTRAHASTYLRSSNTRTRPKTNRDSHNKIFRGGSDIPLWFAMGDSAPSDFHQSLQLDQRALQHMLRNQGY